MRTRRARRRDSSSASSPLLAIKGPSFSAAPSILLVPRINELFSPSSSSYVYSRSVPLHGYCLPPGPLADSAAAASASASGSSASRSNSAARLFFFFFFFLSERSSSRSASSASSPPGPAAAASAGGSSSSSFGLCSCDVG